MKTDGVLYGKLDVPHPRHEADERLNAFYEEVRAAREKHGIADVLIVARLKVLVDGSPTPAFSCSHMGDAALVESMAAWMFGRSIEIRRDVIDDVKRWGMEAGR